MSTVVPLIDGWVGYGDRLELRISPEEPIDADHPLVKERPELFEAPESPKRGPGRPRKEN